jgi:hypothetical protein
MMKKIIGAIFIMFLCISCAKKLYNSADWQSKKVTIDGKNTEWSNPLRFYDEKNRISYSISNDRQNLYLCCSISDEAMQIKILRSGLEFGIDILGKKSFPVTFVYPFGNAALPVPGRNTSPQTDAGSNQRISRSVFKYQLIAEAKEIQLIGFNPAVGRFISLTGQETYGISAAINIDEKGVLVYEAVIPFSTFYKNELTPSDSDKVFNYRIKINPVQGGTSGGGSRGGGMGGGGMRGGGMGGGGMMGGGMRGGMGGGMYGRNSYGNNGENGYQRNASSSGPTKITMKLRLAYR